MATINTRVRISGGDGLASLIAQVARLLALFVQFYMEEVQRRVIPEMRALTPKRSGTLRRSYKASATGADRGEIRSVFYGQIVKFKGARKNTADIFRAAHRKHGEQVARIAWARARAAIL